jgi:hypothetical protein
VCVCVGGGGGSGFWRLRIRFVKVALARPCGYIAGGPTRSSLLTCIKEVWKMIVGWVEGGRDSSEGPQISSTKTCPPPPCMARVHHARHSKTWPSAVALGGAGAAVGRRKQLPNNFKMVTAMRCGATFRSAPRPAQHAHNLQVANRHSLAAARRRQPPRRPPRRASASSSSTSPAGAA